MFIASLVMTSSLLKCFFHHATAIFTFFDYIINKFVNYVPRLNMFQKHHKTYQHYILIYCHNCKQYGFDICLYKVIFNGKKNPKLACNFTINLLYCTSGTKFGNASHITNPNIIDPTFYRIKKYENHPSIPKGRKKMVEEKLSFSFKFIDRN